MHKDDGVAKLKLDAPALGGARASSNLMRKPLYNPLTISEITDGKYTILF
jgi:hypothetical protein